MILLALAGCGIQGADGWFVVLSGVVVDEDGAPLAGADVTLAADDGEPIGTTTTDADGAWSLPCYGTTLTDNVVVALVHADGYAEGRATWEINMRSPETHALKSGPVQTWDATDRRVPAVRLALDSPVVSVTGRVLDAVSGEPVDGVSLSLQQGWNARIGDPAVGDAVTADGGGFRFEATIGGVYTASASAAGSWGSTRFPVFLTGEGGRAVGLVSAPLEPGQLRASIVWGDSPFDLDLHVSAPLRGGQAGEDGTGRYHVWSGAPHHPDRPDENGSYEAEIERDCATGRGPETVVIHDAPGDGSIRLSVFDSDNRSDPENTALADAGVVMQVWYGEDYPRYFAPAPGQIATSWEPVEIDDDTAVPYVVETYAVGVDPADPTAF